MGPNNILTSYRIKHSLKGNGFEYRHDYLKPHIERHERLCVITITWTGGYLRAVYEQWDINLWHCVSYLG